MRNHLALIHRAFFISDIRGAITGAFDIVQSLPEGLKIHFAEQTVALGARLSNLKFMEESVYFLQIAVSSIDLLGHSAGSISIRYDQFDQCHSYRNILLMKLWPLKSQGSWRWTGLIIS